MLLNSYAKINLYLKIGKKLKNNYHEIQSVMQMIQLHDQISFENLDENSIIVESNNKDLENKNNLAYKAALLLKNRFNIRKGVKISIEKQIPLASGLGGGSSNAANTLIALNKLWDIGLTQKRLMNLASEIGSDVPFFVIGKTALVEGFGDSVKPLRKSVSINIVLINPGINISTAWAYKEFDKHKGKLKAKAGIKELVNAVNKKDIEKISENLYNDFNPIIEKKLKAVKEIKINLKKFNALNSLISGSGPTVFGLFDSIYTAREAYFKLRNMYPFVYLTKTF